MNMHYVQRCETWQNAPTACRSGFIEAMRNMRYGAGETQDAWNWFLAGFTAARLQDGTKM